MQSQEIIITPMQAKFIEAMLQTNAKGEPRTYEEAYLAINPTAKKEYARQYGYQLFQQVRTKGMIPLMLEQRGAGLQKVITVLKDALTTEQITVTVTTDPEGKKTSKVTKTNRIEGALRAAEIILKLNGELQTSAQVQINNTINNTQMSFTEAIEFERMQDELKKLKSQKEISDAEFAE